MTLVSYNTPRSSSSARTLRHVLMTIRRATLLLLGASLASVSLSAQTPILTQHYDNARTGQNTTETVLTPSNVNTASFGKLFSMPVDGYVYAQPLYVPALAIPGNGTHNVLYVATEHDSMYAFDADNGTQLWHVTFLINGATTLSPSDVGNTQDINPEIGITGTPTIDATTNTIYVVVNTKESGAIIYRLHAMDITTGAEKFGGPALMTASAPGTASDGNGSSVPFNGQWENQRPGLLLLNGFVYIGFAAHGDNGPWHGWILAYNKTTLAQSGVWCTSPNGRGNGLWAGGSGLAADAAGSIYVATGNGDDTVATPAPPPSTTIDYGDSIVRVGVTNGVPIPTDYFTPWNQASLDGADTDLGAGGVLVVPDQPGPFPHILIQSGKQGEVYVVNRDKMTSDGSHYCNGCTSDPEIIQSITSGGGLWGMPAYWNSQMYLWGTGGHLEAYSLTNGKLSQSPTSTSAESSSFPGPTPVVSSNGSTNGIVWTAESDASTTPNGAILRAYNATDVSDLIYASDLNGQTLGQSVKFVVPVITNGKVYVGTQTEVDVFGLTGGESQAAAPSFSPAPGSYSTGTPVTISSATPNASIYYTIDGSTPTSGSTLYSGPVTVTATTTFNAIAISTGFLQSAVSAATYTIMDQTAPPDVSPAAGTYTSTQSVQLSDTSPTPTIYYTTDGTKPTHSSKQYTGPISITATTTITAIASSPSLNDSPAVTATYTINPNATTINFGLGFAAPTGMQFNGSTDLDDSRLQLTNGGQTEAGSAFFTTPMNITNFTTDFTFQLSDAMADGITFTIQNSSAGAKALGPTGGGLGYGPDTPGGTPGISNSVAVKYDLYNNNGEGDDSTGLYTNGASPTTPATDMTASGVILNNGDTMTVHMTYNGTTLAMTITDTTVNATFSTSWPINIPQTIGGNTAFVGFTGGTGGETASQKIETWTFASTGSAPAQVQTPVITPGSESFSGTLSVSITDATSGSSIYYTTDGSAPVPGAGTTKQYTAALSLTATTTLNAIATASGDTNSATATATYTLQAPAATPVFSPKAGTIPTTQAISISDTTTGAAIHYTTNGSTPTASSTLYSGPVTIAATTTFNAIAISTGFAPSAVATAIYTIAPTATPTISPAAGTYTTTQSVTLSDASPTPTIYYTTNGTTPTHSSTKYTAAISVTSTTTITAIASSPGLSDSPAVTATFTINASSPNINFASGFATSTGLQFNGSAALVSSQLQLTNTSTQHEAGSVFFTTPVNISSFTTNFTFQLTSAVADGFTFTIQNSSAGATAVGPSGGGLGYGPDAPGGTPGISNSVAVKYDLYNNAGEGTDSTGLYTNGASPTTPATDMTSSGVILTSGDIMAVQITYNGTTLTMTITDSTANKTFTTSWPVNIPQTIGGSTAFVGFTAGTGGNTAIQNIKTWTFTSSAPPTPSINFAAGFPNSTGLQFNGSAALSANQLELTNGGGGEASSVFFTTPVNIASFTTNFTFQLTSAQADGFTFTIQNSSAGAAALGPYGGGLGYGPGAPGGTPGISNSVAVKYDLYSNAGEGTDSTGLYTNGASPTTPATDMTSSGVILTSGDTMAVQITYNGTTLTMTITDSTANKTFTTSWPVNIPQTIGGSTAFVGFTAGTGGDTAIQNIKTWTFTSTASTSSAIRVHSGGAAYTDSTGQTWSADTGFSAGNTASTTSSIKNTTDPALYQTERYGSFSYQFAVPNGAHNVTLKFAEIYWTAAGQRIFNVSINGTQVLTNFDIVAAAGAPLTAIDKTFPVTVSNGTVTIQFIVGSIDYPKVSAVEIQ